MKVWPRSEYDPEWTPEQQVAFAALLMRDYSTFVRFFWSVVEPKELIWNWHTEVICKHLQQLHQGTLRTKPTEEHPNGEPCNKLFIAIPPGCMKSSLTSVFYDAWKWLDDPGQRCLVASHDMPLVIRDNVKCRRVVESDAYKLTLQLLTVLGKEAWQMAKDQNQKQYFENTKAGFRQCTTVGAGGTGKRGDSTVVDDPTKIVDILHASPSRQTEILQEIEQWFFGVFSSRLNDLSTGKQTVIAQRVHEEDLPGKLSQDPAWHGLALPMEYDPDDPDEDDPRTEPGELLFPQKFPRDVVEKQKRTMPPGQWAAQYQQKPIPAKGGLVKAEWCTRRYKWRQGDYRENQQLPKMLRTVTSFDCANKAKKLNDPTVATLWGQDSQGTLYLLDLKRERYEYADLEFHAPRWLGDWKPDHILIEDAANGTALLSKLNRTGFRCTPIVPHQDKHVRMSNQTPWFSTGQLILPDNDCTWLPDYLFELLKFPQVRHDDQVDSTSQALLWFTDHPLQTTSGHAYMTMQGTVVHQAVPGAPPAPVRAVTKPTEHINAHTLKDAQVDALRAQVMSLLGGARR